MKTYRVVVILGVAVVSAIITYFLFDKSYGSGLDSTHAFWHIGVELLVAIILGFFGFITWKREEQEEWKSRIEELKNADNLEWGIRVKQFKASVALEITDSVVGFAMSASPKPAHFKSIVS